MHCTMWNTTESILIYGWNEGVWRIYYPGIAKQVLSAVRPSILIEENVRHLSSTNPQNGYSKNMGVKIKNEYNCYLMRIEHIWDKKRGCWYINVSNIEHHMRKTSNNMEENKTKQNYFQIEMNDERWYI